MMEQRKQNQGDERQQETLEGGGHRLHPPPDEECQDGRLQVREQTSSMRSDDFLCVMPNDEKAAEREFRAAGSWNRAPQPPNGSSLEFCANNPASPKRSVHFQDTRRRRTVDRQDSNRNSDTSEINLLQLAAERSRGIYRDDAQYSSSKEMKDGDLWRGSAYDPDPAEQKHMQQHGKNLEGADARVPSPTSSTSNNTMAIGPGAYQDIPGMAIQRTPDFRHEVLLEAYHDSYADASTATGSFTVLPASESNDLPVLDYTSSGEVVSAFRVDEDELEIHIRDEITSSAAQALVVDLESETHKLVESQVEMVRKRYMTYAAIAFSIIIGMVLLGIFKFRKQQHQDMSNAMVYKSTPLTTLASIEARGSLNCGMVHQEAVDWALLHDVVQFNTEMCRALAAAALGGRTNVTLVVVQEHERWQALENGTLDVLLAGTPDSRRSSNWSEVDPNIPVEFSMPYLFEGIGVAGLPQYIRNCASYHNRSGFSNDPDCYNLKVCVVKGSKANELADQRLHPNNVVEVAHLNDLYHRFAAGCCNVLATDYSHERAERIVRNISGFTGPYLVEGKFFRRQPFAAATRKHPWTYNNSTRDSRNDPHAWSEFVNWVINALIAAEEDNITQATADMVGQTVVFGEEYKDMFRHAINAVGSYGEVVDRTLNLVLPRAGMNMINDGTTGLHYSHFDANLADFGNSPYENGTLASIVNRGKLRCGLAMPQEIGNQRRFEFEFGPVELANLQKDLLNPLPGGEITGTARLDYEYCRALSSALFQGRLTIDDLACSALTHEYGTDYHSLPKPNIDLILLRDEADGYAQLNAGKIDVIAGFRMDLQSDVAEQRTGVGFDFTQPYFYGPSEGHVTDANRCLVTRQHDHQWSDFVQLVVMSLFYAEENNLTHEVANEMPVVNLFGPSFNHMMRDTLYAVGNYGEVYSKYMEPVYPREGTTNELNTGSDPLVASMPGLPLSSLKNRA